MSVAELMQFLGSVLLSGVTIYTLWSYLRIRPSLIELRSYAYKRPLVIPRDYDEFIMRLSDVLDRLTGGRRVELLLVLIIIGFVMLTTGYTLDLIL